MTAHHEHLIRTAQSGDRWNPESYRLPPCHGQTVRALRRRGLVWVDQYGPQYGPDSRDRMVYLTEAGEALRTELRAHDATPTAEQERVQKMRTPWGMQAKFCPDCGSQITWIAKSRGACACTDHDYKEPR